MPLNPTPNLNLPRTNSQPHSSTNHQHPFFTYHHLALAVPVALLFGVELLVVGVRVTVTV